VVGAAALAGVLVVEAQWYVAVDEQWVDGTALLWLLSAVAPAGGAVAVASLAGPARADLRRSGPASRWAARVASHVLLGVACGLAAVGVLPLLLDRPCYGECGYGEVLVFGAYGGSAVVALLPAAVAYAVSSAGREDGVPD
jgi:hypothetical protein